MPPARRTCRKSGATTVPKVGRRLYATGQVVLGDVLAAEMLSVQTIGVCTRRRPPGSGTRPFRHRGQRSSRHSCASWRSWGRRSHRSRSGCSPLAPPRGRPSHRTADCPRHSRGVASASPASAAWSGRSRRETRSPGTLVELPVSPLQSAVASRPSTRFAHCWLKPTWPPATPPCMVCVKAPPVSSGAKQGVAIAGTARREGEAVMSPAEAAVDADIGACPIRRGVPRTGQSAEHRRRRPGSRPRFPSFAMAACSAPTSTGGARRSCPRRPPGSA